jgi:hypothetical protein
MTDFTPVNDRTIPHQEKVEAVIDARVAEVAPHHVTGTIASPTAPGATYSQAEAASMKTAVDAIRVKLTAAGITD